MCRELVGTLSQPRGQPKRALYRALTLALRELRIHVLAGERTAAMRLLRGLFEPLFDQALAAVALLRRRLTFAVNARLMRRATALRFAFDSSARYSATNRSNSAAICWARAFVFFHGSFTMHSHPKKNSPVLQCYFPYLLFSKKRYAGLMYTKPDTPDYIDVKGLQLVRRDNCPLVKDVSNAILDKIMYQRCADLAIEEARASVLRVLRHQEPLDKFVVSKALRSDYKNTAQPHLYVAKKITRRTGQPVPSGVRVPFVFVADPANPDGLLAERAEDPEYVREHGLDLDVLHYVEHQLESPITALLELLVDDPTKEVFGSENIAPLMEVLRGQRAQDVKVAKRIRKNVANNQREITAFFSPAR